MKTRFKHLLFAAVPFWIVQLVVLLTGYTDSRVILQIYLPAFIVVTLLLLRGQYIAGHGVWLSATIGLAAEVLYYNSGIGRPTTIGVLLNGVCLLGGAAVMVLLQLAVNAIKKKRKQEKT